MIRFDDESLYEIIEILTNELENISTHSVLEFEIFNQNLKTLVDLAQILQCKILMPTILDDGYALIKFKKLDMSQSFHKSENLIELKYGVGSTFSKINKLKEPAFLYYYLQALKNVALDKRIRILNLGINSGDEFKVIKKYSKNFKNLELVGIDYCKSAISRAKDIFKNDTNISFYVLDINNLQELKLGKFDLIITVGTLQSTSLNFKLIFQSIVQNQLKKDGSIILGFPNCRWIDNEMIYGAKAPNYNFSEMSLLYSDVVFCKKYLQQKKFRVTITGKEYIFLTATSIIK